MVDSQNLALDIEESHSNGDPEARPRPEVMRVCVELACSYLKGGGAPTITRDCASIEEFEHEITRLKTECDNVLAEARAHFADGPGGTRQPQSESQSVAARSAAGGQATEHSLEYLRRELVVGDCMTRNVRTVRRNQKLSIAEELMKVGGFRHVVVVDDEDEIAGVVSHRDIFHGALAWSLGQGALAHQKTLEIVTAKQVMRTDVQTIDSQASLPEAASIMRNYRIGCLPVTENDRLVGIITEGDFLSLLSEQLPPLIGGMAGP